MSIQKKSLISTLKTTKKANVASAPSAESFAKAQTVSPKRYSNMRSLANPKRSATKRSVANPKRNFS
jgi:hypothetical protein